MIPDVPIPTPTMRRLLDDLASSFRTQVMPGALVQFGLEWRSKAFLTSKYFPIAAKLLGISEEEYARRLDEQIATMPKHVMDAIDHGCLYVKLGGHKDKNP